MKRLLTDFTFEELWSDIENNFKWEYVRTTMWFLNWQWEIKGAKRVPTIHDLKETAQKLLLEVFTMKRGSASSGGFCAVYDNGNLALDFTLTAHHTEEFTNANSF